MKRKSDWFVTGIARAPDAWVKRFSKVPKEDIREFLKAFADGFAFDTNRRLKFEPDDKVMDVYTALYPSTGWGDALEVETFVMIIKEKYGVDLSKVGNPDITHGQIFEMTRNPHDKTLDKFTKKIGINY